MKYLRIPLLLILMFTLSTTVMAKDRVIKIEQPRATVYLPQADKATGIAVVDCPGGGYYTLALDHEGHQWAPMFNNAGIAYVVLEYTLPYGDRSLPIADVRRTFELLADSAAIWGIDPEKIGIMGFSAGGHLASTVATHPEEAGVRPAFQILFYPVVSLETEISHGKTRLGFLGENPTDAEVKEYSNYYKVTPQTPKAFIALSANDKSVLPDNSLRYAAALSAVGVPYSLHVYPTGGHGWGYRSSFPYHVDMLWDFQSWINDLVTSYK